MSTINKLVSLNNHLNKDFIKHIETTKNLCLYKLGNHYIPSNIFFPNARILTLINCNSTGIKNILHPSIFPNINTVNFLSTNVENNKLHTQLNSYVDWVFPDKNYEYYNYMVQRGLGKKCSSLIKEYVTNKKIIDGKNGFDISFEFDIKVPEHGVVNGDWWRSQFYEYLVKKQNNEIIYDSNFSALKLEQEIEEINLEKELVAKELYFEDLVDNN